jgi:uncharacterized repeat protein (TIGR01451 family)
MRSKRYLWALLAVVITIASTVAVAGGIISGTSGGVVKLATPPASVAPNALENATSAVTFNERSAVTLPAAVKIDGSAPGTYTTFPLGTATLPKGTVVDSHLIHSDPPARLGSISLTGSVTFRDDIIGVIAATNRLGASDAALGAPGTTYAGTTNWRGLEGAEGTSTLKDKYTVSADKRTISFELNTSVMDEIRVLTKPSNPLVTTITDTPDPVQAGNDVQYTITVTNIGDTPASNVQVADAFPGATLVSANASGGCTGTGPVTCSLGTIAGGGGSAQATVTVKSPDVVPGSGLIANTATAPPGQSPTTEPTTVVAPSLTTDITDAPDPVTAGNDVQYALTVTNTGIATVPDAHVVNTLPPGTTLVTATAPDGCTGTGPVDCDLGPLAAGASAQAFVVATTDTVVPAGGTITDSATATPGSNPTATQVTTVEEPTPGVSKGFVLPGGSIGIDGENPATVTLPDTGDGAPIVITQGAGTFCDGPCSGTATTIAPFPGYTDPNHPIHALLVYNFSGSPTSLTDAATAYGATIYKNNDPLHPNVGSPVPFCNTPGSGVADPSPCVNAHTITQPTFGSFVVTFDIVYLSGDPSFARR